MILLIGLEGHRVRRPRRTSTFRSGRSVRRAPRSRVAPQPDGLDVSGPKRESLPRSTIGPGRRRRSSFRFHLSQLAAASIFSANAGRRPCYSAISIISPHSKQKLRSSKLDLRRQPRIPVARRGVALRKKIVAGLLLATALIFLALVIGGVFR